MLEHRQVHGDDDDADHEADADHHDRLDDRGQRLDRRVDLVLVEVRDLGEHLLELTGLLADLHHLRDHRREDGARRSTAARSWRPPGRGRARGSVSFSTTQLPDVCAVISSALMMSTPDAISVDRVRDQRAIATLRTTDADLHRDAELEPIPRLAAGLRPLPAEEAEDDQPDEREDDEPEAAQPVRRESTYCVSVGSSPPSESKTLTNTGTRNISIPTRTSVAKHEHDRRVDHRALHAPLDLLLLLDLRWRRDRAPCRARPPPRRPRPSRRRGG